MAQARVIVLNEVKIGQPDNWNLCFQHCLYQYEDSEPENGYRFIWRRENGDLQGARGQARIPSISDIQYLTGLALKAGWGHHDYDSLGY